MNFRGTQTSSLSTILFYQARQQQQVPYSYFQNPVTDSSCINVHFLHGKVIFFNCYFQAQISHPIQPSISKPPVILKYSRDQASKILQGKNLTKRSHPQRSPLPSSSLAGGNYVLTLKTVSKVQDTVLFHAKFPNLICLSNLLQHFKEWFWRRLGGG